MDKEGFVSIDIVTESEELSYHLNKFILNSLEEFHVDKNKSQEISSIKVLESKLDSIVNEMDRVEDEFAVWKEKNIETMNAASMVDDLRFQRKLELLNKMFVETYKSLEFKRINVQFNEQYIRVVNFPTLPIYSKKFNVIVYFAVASILGLVLGSIFVIVIQTLSALNRGLKEIE